MKKENKIVLPDGDELQDETLAIPTERTIEREHEETEYTPVIIKRWDEGFVTQMTRSKRQSKKDSNSSSVLPCRSSFRPLPPD